MSEVIDVTPDDHDYTPKIISMSENSGGYKIIKFTYDGYEFEIDQNVEENAILFVKHGNSFYNVNIPDIRIDNLFTADDKPQAIHQLMQVLYSTSLVDIEQAAAGIMPEMPQTEQ